MNRPIQNDESVSIELDEEDLLDIDGSDDPTTAFAGKGMLGKLAKLRAPTRKRRTPSRPFANHGGDDPTIVKTDRGHYAAPPSDRPSRDDVRETIPVPMKLGYGYFNPPAPPSAAAPIPAAMAPKSPTISPVPSVRSHSRDANASYPPIAISVPASRPMAMSFVSERPSRAGWLAAAVMGALILIGGSIQVAAPKAHTAPAPVAAAPVPAPVQAEEPKVVTFGDSQGVSIKPKAEAPKAEAAAAQPKKAAALPHGLAKPAPKAISRLPDNSLALSKEEKKEIPATSHDAPSKDSKLSSAEQKKLRSIEQDLADLQLKAAAR